MKTAKDLLLSFVNATLMLAVMLVVCLIVLVGKVTTLRDSTAQMVAQAVEPQKQRIGTMSANLQNLNDKLSTANAASIDLEPVRAELQELNEQVADLRQALKQSGEVSAKAITQQVLRTVADSLGG